jgi:hypothetical protein
MHGAVPAAGSEHRVGGWQVGESLGLAHASDGMLELAKLQGDNRNRVVLELRDEEPPPRQVHSHMIDTAPNVTQRDLLLEGQTVLGGSRRFAVQSHSHRGREKNSASH